MQESESDPLSSESQGAGALQPRHTPHSDSSSGHRVAQIDRVCWTMLAGGSRKDALAAGGYGPTYHQLFQSSLYKERLEVQRAVVESELVDIRTALTCELIALARDGELAGRDRVAAYKILGEWSGMASRSNGQPQNGSGPAGIHVQGGPAALDKIVSKARNRLNEAV